MKRYLLALLLSVAAASTAQDAPEPKDAAAVKQADTSAKAEPPAETKEIPEEFAPSEELSEDSSVAFPVDI